MFAIKKTLEMFPGLPPILFNSFRVSSGSSRRIDDVRLATVTYLGKKWEMCWRLIDGE